MEGFDADFGSLILGSMSSGVVAIDSEHRIVIMNDGARRMLGGASDEPGPGADSVLGEDCEKVLAAQPAVSRLLIETLEAQSPLSRAELALDAVGGAGSTIIGLTLSPVHDRSGRRCGAAMFFRDLTPFERADEQARLRERLAALGEMAADLAHELRNPLAGVEVVAGLLLRRLTDRPAEQALVEQIIGELRNLADTVTASLDFVSPVKLVPELLDPVDLIETAIAQADSRVAFEVRVERDFAPDPTAIFADRDRLQSVLTNLVVNAYEAMAGVDGERRLEVGVRRFAVDRARRPIRVESDGRIAVQPDGHDSELEITIRDTGTGIPAELREKVFYPFFTTKERGSGIGLAGAQKVITSHGGMIEVAAHAGPGASFRLRLPVASPPPEGARSLESGGAA
jgi:nitrogen-specific signal transduction histidine kinase